MNAVRPLELFVTRRDAEAAVARGLRGRHLRRRCHRRAVDLTYALANDAAVVAVECVAVPEGMTSLDFLAWGMAESALARQCTPRRTRLRRIRGSVCVWAFCRRSVLDLRRDAKAAENLRLRTGRSGS